jgi:hypothetical protein
MCVYVYIYVSVFIYVCVCTQEFKFCCLYFAVQQVVFVMRNNRLVEDPGM